MLGVVLFFLLAGPAAAQNNAEEIADFIKEKQKVVESLSEAAERAYRQRSLHVENCRCSRHACANDIGKNARCYRRLGSSSECDDCSGTLLDYSRSAVRLAPGTDPRNMTVKVKESICTFRALDSEFRQSKVDTWTYVGTVDGAFRLYPVRQLSPTPDGEELFQNCPSFDPRIRPWYIAASTGPKDVVLLIDKSGSMTKPVDSPRWDLTEKALSSLLDTFTPADFVNIVTFESEASVVMKKQPLHSATEKNRKKFKKQLKKVLANGGTDFNNGFHKAFDLLEEASSEAGDGVSSGCTKVIIFLTDGEDCSASEKRTPCSVPREGGPEQLLANIEERQVALEEKTGSRALIFTFSMGTDADDSIPKQIACANNGTWSFLEDGDDPLLKLSSYYTYLAAARYPGQVTWAEPFEDSDGLGMITTAAKAIYSSSGRGGTNGVQIGVVGHDVMLSELALSNIPSEDIAKELAGLSRACDDDLKLEPCQLQVQRDHAVDHATCPDRLPKRTCYEFVRRWYARVDSRMDQESAQKECKSQGGDLVSIRSELHLAAMAALASPRGSWVGAKKVRFSKMFKWIDESILSFDNTSTFWGVGEPHDEKIEAEECVTIDPRGVKHNMADHVCTDEYSFICEFRSKPAFCGNSFVTIDPESFFEVPPLDLCRDAEDILGDTEPVPGAKALEPEDVLCSLGKSAPLQNLLCCSGCPLESDFDETEPRWPLVREKFSG